MNLEAAGIVSKARVNAKCKGRRREYTVRDILRARGFDVVRAAGSLGPADLVALHPSLPTLMVQVKSRDWPHGTEALGLVALAERYRGRAVVQAWRFIDGSTEPSLRTY
jgi:Holliday junction resolvase